MNKKEENTLESWANIILKDCSKQQKMIYEFIDLEDDSYSFKIETDDYNYACMKYIEFLKEKELIEVNIK